jgi:hypothetical protein
MRRKSSSVQDSMSFIVFANDACKRKLPRSLRASSTPHSAVESWVTRHSNTAAGSGGGSGGDGAVEVAISGV